MRVTRQTSGEKPLGPLLAASERAPPDTSSEAVGGGRRGDQRFAKAEGAVTLRAVKDPDSRPEILVGLDIDTMTKAAIEHLGADPMMYRRGTELVYVVHKNDRCAPVEAGDVPRIGPPAGVPTILTLKTATLKQRLSTTILWKKQKEDRWIRVLPPDAVVQAVMAAREYPRVPYLAHVTTTPTLRPDGTLVQTPGYDKATGILYMPPRPNYFPQVDEHPTLDDALRAKHAILSVVQDFPFAGPEYLSAWFSGLLTCIVRTCIEGPCPLFLVDATTPGTGKTLLAKVTGLLALGFDFASFTQPDDEADFRKRVSSILKGGAPIALIDNVTRNLGGGTIDSLLTSTLWGDRQLGVLEVLEVPNLAVWWATGNNVEFWGDTPRRVLRTRLEARTEKPQDRTGFAEPHLKDFVLRERHKLVAQALTIVRAWFAGGCPYRGELPWGGFPEWSDVLPPVLHWIGMEDPRAARASEDVFVDQDLRNLLAIHDGLARLDPDGKGLAARTMLALLFAEKPRSDVMPTLPGALAQTEWSFAACKEAIESVTGARGGHMPETARFARYLGKVRGRIARGKKIVRAGETSDGSVLWTVVADGGRDGAN